ncbi:hypothetical protein BKA61DRAFT_677164 [Leptodontidium sp. MPI-SDFR-AT-0119]|nr:hypothetical protein BKA61DRAFT_677164 [Leptodontidium sp. MPI-SDFR-AT-0119]
MDMDSTTRHQSIQSTLTGSELLEFRERIPSPSKAQRHHPLSTEVGAMPENLNFTEKQLWISRSQDEARHRRSNWFTEVLIEKDKLIQDAKMTIEQLEIRDQDANGSIEDLRIKIQQLRDENSKLVIDQNQAQDDCGTALSLAHNAVVRYERNGVSHELQIATGWQRSLEQRQDIGGISRDVSGIIFFDSIAIRQYGEEFVDGATGTNNPDDVFHIGKTLVAIATETEQTAERFRRDKSHLDNIAGWRTLGSKSRSTSNASSRSVIKASAPEPDLKLAFGMLTLTSSAATEIPVVKTRPGANKRSTWFNSPSNVAPMPILPTIRSISPISDAVATQAIGRTLSYNDLCASTN